MTEIFQVKFEPYLTHEDITYNVSIEFARWRH